ncbi:hypothetical protein [Anaerospora hongkongensis]|uniref:hypothetical protein n=1 Tax=Anaerospora hongkongensis TaxID=244830 RepID=UPI00105169F4|nr:hypothetical protein [Anaerospora hongkongensis]
MLPQVPASSPYFPVRLRCRYSRRLAILAFEQPVLGGRERRGHCIAGSQWRDGEGIASQARNEGTARALHRRLAMGNGEGIASQARNEGTAKALHRRLAMKERRRHCIAGSQ